MNIFDIIVGLLLLFALFKGFKNGLVTELASLAALVLGLFGAIKFSDVTAEYLSPHINSSHIGLISFFLTFILIVIGIHFIAKLINKLLDAVALGAINRILGAAFSVLKYAFIISVLLAVLNGIDKNGNIISEKQKRSSVLYGPVSNLAVQVFPYLHFDDVKKKAEDVTKGVKV
jgi:membrane protein required for colicin V production